MVDLNEILVFCRVAQAGSFTAAARVLGLPKSTVSRKIQDLETRLGVTLLKRTTRKLHLTDAGQQLFQGSRGPLADLESLTELTAANQSEPQGRVRVTAPTDVGNVVLSKVLSGFLKRHPKLVLDLSLTDRRVDLVGEGFDIAIRVGNLPDSSLVARKIGMTHSRLFASPNFVKREGPFRHPRDVEEHLRFRFSLVPDDQFLLLRGPGGTVKLQCNEVLAVDSFLVIRELLLQSQGIGMIPGFLAHEDVERKRLVTVLPEWSGRSAPLSLLYSRQRFLSPGVRSVLDFLHESLPPFFND